MPSPTANQRAYEPDKPTPTPGAARRGARAAREAIRRNPKADKAYRTTVGVIGTGTTALGVVLMPLPGPGALIALGGLSILATEFESAGRARDLGVRGLKAAGAKAKEFRDDYKKSQAGAQQPSRKKSGGRSK